MGAIRWEDVREVRLATSADPAVQAHLRRVAYWAEVQREGKEHERREERTRVAAVMQAPFAKLLTQEAMLAHYITHIAPTRPRHALPAPTSRACRHGAEDKWRPAAWICWYWRSDGRPRRLATLEPCSAFVDNRPEAPPATQWEWQQEMEAYWFGFHWAMDKDD